MPSMFFFFNNDHHLIGACVRVDLCGYFCVRVAVFVSQSIAFRIFMRLPYLTLSPPDVKSFSVIIGHMLFLSTSHSIMVLVHCHCTS